MVNTKRGVMELLESAMGSDYANADLIILHGSIGHNFQDLVDQAHDMAPNARIVAASCCGVVGVEGVSESMKDIALMAVKGKDVALASVDGIKDITPMKNAKKWLWP